MKRVKIKHCIVFFVLFICGIFLFQSVRTKDKYFLEIPLNTSKHREFYFLDIEIENNTIPLALDTGCQTTICLDKDVMEKIKNKKKRGTITSYDVNGNEYTNSRYLVHSIKMGKVKIAEATIDEENLDSFVKGSELVKSDENTSSKDDEEDTQEKMGYFGVEALREHEYWLLDFPNSKMYMIGKLEESLKKLKISLEDFMEIPLQANSPHIVITVDTDFGVKDFALDTGENRIIMRRPSEDYSPHQTVISKKFIANENDLEEKEIYLFDFDSSFKFDGFLGIDFLKNSAVLLDFKNNKVFISPKKQ